MSKFLTLLIPFTRQAKSGQRFGMYQCICGKVKEIANGAVNSGNTRSCGCKRAELVSRHSGHDWPEYNVWAAMKDRCNNPNAKNYKWYGARGISVCEQWNDFKSFIEDMGRRPPGRLTLERINNDGNYEPNNCRWATYKEQALNTSRNRPITYKGKTQSVAKWADEVGISHITITTRISRGWPIERALDESVKPRKRRT